jgi:predicted transport protein
MGQTPDDMMSAVSASLAARTGRSLAEWVTLVQASGLSPLDQNAVRRWLRSEHGVPQNSQWAIADAAAREAGWVRPGIAEYVQAQYQGPKAALRPIYDALASVITGLGDDVTAEGRSTYIPFARSRQFAAIAAATRDRVDLGLRFTAPPASGRAQPATAPGQATHKVPLHSVQEIDGEVLHLLQTAYEQNA